MDRERITDGVVWYLIYIIGGLFLKALFKKYLWEPWEGNRSLVASVESCSICCRRGVVDASCGNSELVLHFIHAYKVLIKQYKTLLIHAAFNIYHGSTVSHSDN